jgi:predicted ATPase
MPAWRARIAAAEGKSALGVLDLIDALAAKSLVVAETHSAGMRFRFLETTRSYALGRLVESGDFDSVARRHARYVANLLQGRSFEMM